MAVQLICTEAAIGHLHDIAEYISLASDTRAAHVVTKIVESAEILKRLPRQGRVVPEFDRDDLRETDWRKYRIVHQVAGDRVAIVAVVHGARRMEHVLTDFASDL